MQGLSPETLSLEKIFERETIPIEPILLITTPGLTLKLIFFGTGADPSTELRELAQKEVGSEGFIEAF